MENNIHIDFINNSKTRRNSGVELLRILSMILIVAHHYSLHGFSNMGLNYGLNKYLIDILSSGGKLGVNCFVLISGYYMCNSKFTIKKLFKIIGEIWFYSVIILLLFTTILTPVSYIGVKDILHCIFPTIYNQYWFATSFIVLMILTPFLNKLIMILDKIAYRKLLILLYGIWSAIACLISGELAYNSFGWFCLLYLTAGYIRNYIDIERISIKKCRMILILTLTLLLLSVIGFDMIGYKFDIQLLLKKSTQFRRENSILIVILSIDLLLIFLRKNIYNKFINKIASATFGVYLIHDNNFMRPYLWKSIFNCEEMFQSNFLILHALFAIVSVYTVCTLIDLARQVTVERVYLKIINKIIAFFKEEMIIEKYRIVFVNLFKRLIYTN